MSSHYTSIGEHTSNITFTDTDTQKDTQGPYLYNDSTTIFFNDTLLNATIGELTGNITFTDTNTNETGGWLNDTVNTTTSLDAVILGAIFAYDWSNVTLTESQISDLTHTVDTNTQKDSQGPYLYNDTTTIFFNESYLNQTIGDHTSNITFVDTDTDTNETGGWNNNSVNTTTSLDVFILGLIAANDWSNVTITESQISDLTHTVDTNTQKDTVGPYIYNDSTHIYFNDSVLNQTIGDHTSNITFTDTDTQKDSQGPYLYNDSTTMYFNESILNQTIGDHTSNITFVDTNTDTNETGGWNNNSVNTTTTLDVIIFGLIAANDWSNITITESQISDLTHTVDTNTQKDTIGPYLYNDSTYIYFNDSVLNQSIGEHTSNITFTDTDTQKDTQGPYLYNDTTIIYFNESILNQTIGDHTSNITFVDTDTDTNETGGWNNNSINTTTSLDVFILGLIAANDWSNVTITESQISDLSHTVDTNTQKDTVGPYLYNDSTFIYFNGSVLNQTIGEHTSNITGITDTQKNASGPYLYNDSTTILFNESVLNQTIGDHTSNITGITDTQKNTSGPYLYNDSTTIFFNESVLNATVGELTSNITYPHDQDLNKTDDVVFQTVNITGFNSGDLSLDEVDLEIGGEFGAIEIGNSQIFKSNLTVEGLNFSGTMGFGNFDSDSNIEFLFATEDNKINFVIATAGTDFASYVPRSFMVGGLLGQSFNDSIVSCTTQGYNQIDCNTGLTGADLGIQDDLEVQGTIYVNEIVIVDEVPICLKNDTGFNNDTGIAIATNNVNISLNNLTVFSDDPVAGAAIHIENAHSDMTIGETYGGMYFIGHDVSASADGLRASILARSFDSQGGTALVFSTARANAAENINMVIYNDRVGINTTFPGYTLEVAGDAGIPGGAWVDTSDESIKENISDGNQTSALETIMKLNGTRFNYKNPENFSNITWNRWGLIAQQVNETMPEWVTVNRETGLLGVRPIGFEALVIEGFKEQQRYIDGMLSAPYFYNSSDHNGNTFSETAFNQTIVDVIFAEDTTKGKSIKLKRLTLEDLTNETPYVLEVNGVAGIPGGVWSDTSDISIKKDVKDMSSEDALTKLDQLQGHKFKYKEPEKYGNITYERMGFVAQEVQTVFPEWVQEDRNGLLTIVPVGIHALVVEAIKEQNKKIAEQQDTIDELQQRINVLESHICKTDSKAPFC